MLGLRPGYDVIVTLGEKETYIGQISFVAPSYIEIMQSVHLKTSATVDLKCYESDITFIKMLKQPQQIVNGVILFSYFTFNELLEMAKMLKNYVFIERFDQKYHNAIDEINKESYIGLCIPGTENGRFSDISLIAVTTSKSIFLFDIVVMGRVEKLLKNILEGNVPKKVVHDASLMADYLKQQKINLNGVFDTMIAHCSLRFGVKSSLQKCLHDHFKLPTEFLDSVSCEIWHIRPLTTHRKRLAAQNVVFLRKLYFHFYRLMMQPLYKLF